MVALTDASGTIAASYSYDAFGVPTASSERFANGWSNPYRYDGRDGVRYDSEMGLYWLSTRAYDPTVGRFISRDPLGRVPLFFADQPYAYAGNNPLVNVDPSGERYLARYSPRVAPPAPQPSRVVTRGGGGGARDASSSSCSGDCAQIDREFHNQRTQDAMHELVHSRIGSALLGFLLQVGRAIGNGYIAWDRLPCGGNGCEEGYTTFGGRIQLNTNLGTLGAAATLVHEAVESYFAVEFGLRTPASQRMDYVAQWFEGEFEAEHTKYPYDNTFKGKGYYGAYGLTFDQWTQTPDYRFYESQFPTQLGSPVISQFFVFTPGWFGAEIVPHWVGPYVLPLVESKAIDLFGVG